jgi:hypothetical protein
MIEPTAMPGMPATTGSETGFGPQLPAELISALRRATEQTLGSLHSLRTALREHVHHERGQGASLNQIEGGLRDMVDTAAGDVNDPAYSSERVGELKAQVIKWSGLDFRRPTSAPI